MSQVLANFVQVLRAADIRVSTAESMDAAATVAAIGYTERELLKGALSLVLAKTPDDKHKFDACFDRFFAFEAASAEPALEGANEQREQPGQECEGQGGSGGSGTGGGGLEALLTEGDASALQQAIAEAAREVKLQNIRMFTQRGMYARRILEAMGVEELERKIFALVRAKDEPERMAALRERKARLTEDVMALVDRQMLLYTANAYTSLREEVLQKTPLSRIEMGDFAIMKGLVSRLAKRLVSMHSRRRRIANRGQLDLRRTLRRNIEYDGLLMETVWKRSRIDRPKIVAVCDVSGSVAQYSRFLLLFLYSVSEVLPKVRSFAFSSQLGEVTEWFQQKTVEEALALTFKHYGMGSTDYGGALAELERLTANDIDHRTTVLILGDGRSNYGDPGDRVLRRIHQRARRVLWLNPEPRSFWNIGDSAMQKLSASCDRVDTCRTLVQLERVVNEIARAAV